MSLSPDLRTPISQRWIWFAVLAPLVLLLLAATRGLAFRSAKRLDERELQVGLLAHQSSYGAVITVMLASTFADFTRWNPFALAPSVTLTLDDLIYWFFLSLLAPTVFIAWTEPNPPEEASRPAG